MLTLAGQYIFSKKQGLPVHQSWKVSLIGCPSEHCSPSNGMNVGRANRAVCDVSEESVDVHFIFLCVVAGYSVTLNPNRQLAYIVER